MKSKEYNFNLKNSRIIRHSDDQDNGFPVYEKIISLHTIRAAWIYKKLKGAD